MHNKNILVKINKIEISSISVIPSDMNIKNFFTSHFSADISDQNVTHKSNNDKIALILYVR